MKILAVDGIPVPQEKEQEPKPISTDKKIQILKAADEDLEWYPTTPEIMEAMRKDIWKYLRSHENYYAADRGGIRIDRWWDDQKEKENLYIYIHFSTSVRVMAGCLTISRLKKTMA